MGMVKVMSQLAFSSHKQLHFRDVKVVKSGSVPSFVPFCTSSGSEGMVEDVVLLGAPVDGSEKAWERIATVVAGKIVNGYCR